MNFSLLRKLGMRHLDDQPFLWVSIILGRYVRQISGSPKGAKMGSLNRVLGFKVFLGLSTEIPWIGSPYLLESWLLMV